MRIFVIKLTGVDEIIDFSFLGVVFRFLHGILVFFFEVILKNFGGKNQPLQWCLRKKKFHEKWNEKDGVSQSIVFNFAFGLYGSQDFLPGLRTWKKKVGVEL